MKDKLDDVVASCVNGVGVELNTASKQLLSYVSGIGPTLSQNIVEYRNEHGAFKSRKEIMKVPRMGEKVFEQCAGFLRIRDGVHPLDKSAVHPESYHIVEKMAKDLNCGIDDLIKDKELRKKMQFMSTWKPLQMPRISLPAALNSPSAEPRFRFNWFPRIRPLAMSSP